MSDLFLGRSWFDRFIDVWHEYVQLLSKKQILDIENDPITFKCWIYERDYFTRFVRMPKRYATKDYIFVIEAVVVEICRGNTLQYLVIVSTLKLKKRTFTNSNSQACFTKVIFPKQFTYNAHGKMLKPLVLHSGEANGFIVDFYRKKMDFLKTDSGMIDKNSVCFAFDQIQR